MIRPTITERAAPRTMMTKTQKAAPIPPVAMRPRAASEAPPVKKAKSWSQPMSEKTSPLRLMELWMLAKKSTKLEPIMLLISTARAEMKKLRLTKMTDTMMRGRTRLMP